MEESGTTDFAGALLRYFAAQGICHGHVIHVVGVGESWVRELPGVTEDSSNKDKSSSTDDEKMKIAWRYERLGQASERGAWRACSRSHDLSYSGTSISLLSSQTNGKCSSF